jgi:hypothetical protein
MAKRTEADLRKAKASATAAVVDQQRKLGVPVPGGRAVDEFVEPIVAKMAREELRTATPEAAPREHSDEVESQYVGTYDWNLKDDTWKAADPGSYIPSDIDRMHRIVQQLMKLPAWKAELMKARSVCDKHYFGGVKPGCKLCVRREEAVKQVLLKAYQQFGNPWRGREKRIVIT